MTNTKLKRKKQSLSCLSNVTDPHQEEVTAGGGRCLQLRAGFYFNIGVREAKRKHQDSSDRWRICRQTSAVGSDQH